MNRPYNSFRIISFQTLYGTEEYIIHSVFPKLEIFQLQGPRDIRTWQETNQVFRSKVGFLNLLKLSLQIAYVNLTK